MTDRSRISRSLLLLTFGTAILLAGCQQDVRHVEQPAIKAPETPEHALVELSKVFQGDKQVGWLRTFRYRTERNIEFTRVYNLRNDDLGWVTQDGRAFRKTAHGGPDLVANNTDMSKNVAAVFGQPLVRMRIETVASARE